MVRSQARGIIDWSEVRFFDRTWWRRARWLMEAMLADEEIRLREAEHLHAIALRTAAGGTRFSDQSWENAHNHALDCLDRLIEVYRPWEKRDRETRERQAAKKLVSAWTQAYGDPDDPQTKQKIAEVVEAMRRMAEQEPPEIRAFRTATPPPPKFARRR